MTTQPRHPSGGSDDAEFDRRFGEIVGGLGTPEDTPTPPASFDPLDGLDEGYVPPEPEPLEVARPELLLAGALVVVPVLVLLASVLLTFRIGLLAQVLMGLCVLGGAIWFVTLLPRNRDPDDPGAVV